MQKVPPLLAKLFAFLMLVTFSLSSSPAWAGQKKEESGDQKKVLDSAGIERLIKEAGGKTVVSTSVATGGVRFISFRESSKIDLTQSAKSASLEDKSQGFFRQYGSVFGLRNALEELRLVDDKTDRLGNRHLSYVQQYRGVPVFAGELKTHFDAAGKLSAVNGNIIPEIELNAVPSKTSEEAAQVALGKIMKERGKSKSISVQDTRLYIYRTGLAQGVLGKNHLVWQVEVGNRKDVREFVFVDAHTGSFVDQLTGVMDSLNRRAYDGEFIDSPDDIPIPPNYPDTPFWKEGDNFPTGNAEADNIILSSKEIYDLYNIAFGRDSYNGAGAVLDAIFNRGYTCPNASWNGLFTSFCPGISSDETLGHEWTHAYTEFTHNLIYKWQPGALNEAYSDIFGETLDLINGRGSDTPNTLRTAGECSVAQLFPPITRVTEPPGIAGDYPAGFSRFSPIIVEPGITGQVLRADDGVGNLTDGCGAEPTFLSDPNSWTNALQIAGKIAFIDRGACFFADKVLNAQRQGAIGVIIANVATSNQPEVPPVMGGISQAEAITIAVVSMNFTNGELLRNALASGLVTATLKPSVGTLDNSVRWFLGEDDLPIPGIVRDMWTPTCFDNPGKVSDSVYFCGAEDNGGVHINSGVPSHAYALLVDGGEYNGQTIKGIGMTKAAHIYFRAMNVYQTSGSDFADHADAIQQSAFDLLFDNLPDLKTGAPSGQRVGLLDLLQIHRALVAVEMRKTPNCVFGPPLLGQTPPPDPVCGPGLGRATKLKDGFEGDTSQWTISKFVFSDAAGFTERDWSVVDDLPDKKKGKAFFAPDPDTGNCITTSEHAFLDLTSPAITIPGSIGPGTTLTFNHWVSTEPGFDFALLLYSVDGGTSLAVVPDDHFIYNGYNFPGTGWSGTDDGTVEGSWGKTMIDLNGLVVPGQSIQFMWSMFSDGCIGRLGWYVDDVHIYTCEPDADADGIADSSDLCPNSDHITNPIVVIGTGKNSNTGVTNKVLDTGCTFQQKIKECAANSANQLQFAACVGGLTHQWVLQGLITPKEELKIILAALTAKNWK